MRSYADVFVRSGRTAFIHPTTLYRPASGGLPSPLQDAFATCAAYFCRTEATSRAVFALLEARTNALLQPRYSSDLDDRGEAQAQPLADKLARMQALVLLQSVRLLDGDIRQRALAEAQEPLLERLTVQLLEQYRQQEQEDQRSDGGEATWTGWVAAESVRRTAIAALMLRGIYALLKSGFCTLSPQVSCLSFTAQAALWGATTEGTWSERYARRHPFLVANMDFDDVWLRAQAADLDDLGLIMMATYKGYDSLQSWLRKNQGEGVTDAAPVA